MCVIYGHSQTIFVRRCWIEEKQHHHQQYIWLQEEVIVTLSISESASINCAIIRGLLCHTEIIRKSSIIVIEVAGNWFRVWPGWSLSGPSPSCIVDRI